MASSFYTVEGMDGSGKSSISKHLGTYLTQRGIPTLVVEAYPRDEESMFMRDLWIQRKVPDVAVLVMILELRKRVLENQIIPALLAGKVVVSDRWHDTTWAYQHYGMGISTEVMDTVFPEVFNLEKVLSKYIFSDRQWLRRQILEYRTIHLDIDIETSRERVGNRNVAKDAFEKESDDFFLRIQEGYRKIYRLRNSITHRPHEPGTLFLIDAKGSLDSTKQGIETIMDCVTPPVPPNA